MAAAPTLLEHEALSVIASCWNTLDASILKNHLSDDFIYESQWVITPIIGKELFLHYFTKKLNVISASKKEKRGNIKAEIIAHPYLTNKKCVLLTQLRDEGPIKVLLEIQIHDHLIKRIDLSFMPSIND